MQVAITDIAIVRRQRTTMDVTKLAELAKTIEEIGLLHPIVIRHPHDGEEKYGKPYILCVGGRRIAAYIMLRRTHIEASLKEDLDPINAEIAELDENIKRENITWEDEVAARARIHELRLKQDPFQTLQKTADEIGISVAQLHKDIELNKAVKADPTLKKHDTKGRAIRKAKHKAHLKEREQSAAKSASSSLMDLRQKIRLADARDVVRSLTSASIDLVFCDLPFGMDADANIKDAEQLRGHYDDSREKNWDLITDLVPQFCRVLKPTGWLVLFMSFEGYDELAELVHKSCTFHGEYCTETRGVVSVDCNFLEPELPPWFWYRRSATNMGHWPELHAANRIDMLLVANGGKARLSKPCTNVIEVEGDVYAERFHYMQKDFDGCRRIIERCTVQGELVADFTCGGGNLLAAAADLGRDILGCENNPDSYEAAIANVAKYFKPEAVRWAIERGRLGAAQTAKEIADYAKEAGAIH